MSKLLVCLIVLVVVLNNVNSIPLFGNLITNLRTLEQYVADKPLDVQEVILASYLNGYASHFPMAFSNDDPLTEDRRTLTNKRNSLGVDRPGVRESANRYPWNRRGYVPEKDISREPKMLPPHILEEMLANSANFHAGISPMQYGQDDPLTADGRSLTNKRNSLGVDRPGVRESANRYPWNRRGYVPEKDIERFLISEGLKERRHVPLEN